MSWPSITEFSMERQNITENARNMLTTKIGKALLDDYKFPGRILKLKLHQIDTANKHQQALLNNNQRLFRNTRLIYNYEPTMVVERPPSPAKQVYATVQTDIPHYMSDLDKNKPLGYYQRPTVDAFKVLRNRKKNIWETKNTERDLHEKFRSILLKSPPISSAEQYDLDRGWTVYRPVSRVEEQIQKRLQDRRKHRHDLAKSVKPNPPSRSTFITEHTATDTGMSERIHRRSTLAGRVGELSANHRASLRQPLKPDPPFKLEYDKEKLAAFDEMREKNRRGFYQNIHH